MIQRAFVILFFIGILVSRAALPAFPGAEGFGANTIGGRGGKVLFVTTLEDYDKNEKPVQGSFRLACETSGAKFLRA